MKQINSVLLIDDSWDCNFIMSQFIKLADSSIEVQMAESVAEALDQLEQGPFPDIIYVDVNMPVSNGFDFLRRFEEEYPDRLEKTQIFMLSSSLRQEDKEQALAFESVHAFLSKDDLDNVLRETLR